MSSCGARGRSRSGEAVTIICAAGDIHGALDYLYEDVLAFEEALDVRFAWVLNVGDFGIWQDPARIDRGTRSRCCSLLSLAGAPRPTVQPKVG